MIVEGDRIKGRWITNGTERGSESSYLPPCLTDQCFEPGKLGDGITVDDFDVAGFQSGDRQAIFIMQRVADAIEQHKCIFEGFEQLRRVDDQAGIGFSHGFVAFTTTINGNNVLNASVVDLEAY